MVFNENCSYGYRRNLLGLRPIGIGMCAASLGLCMILAVLSLTEALEVDLWAVAAAAVVAAGLLSVWLSVVKPEWVRDAGDAYAERLLATAFVL